jgi:hypothetical protein
VFMRGCWMVKDGQAVTCILVGTGAITQDTAA